jgi:ubiquinone biosynthesis protein
VATSILRYHQRYREISGTVSRHGLWWIVQQFGLDQVPVLGRVGLRRRGQPDVMQPRHLRLALEELGTTFIKLGQILSTRDDLLPPEYIAELSLLRERVQPVPVEDILPVIAEDLGAPVGELFAAFEMRPLAAASIGQVHAARLHDGMQVVVKVQRPGVAEQVEQDLAILRQLASFAQRRAPLAEYYDLVELADEFAWTLRNELDYVREGRNADTFRAGLAGNEQVVIPRVCWERTAGRVVTFERIDGLRIDDVAALDTAGVDRPALARRAAGVVLDEVFRLRFFHADPHPGNFAVLDGGTIVAYDFGMVGTLRPRTSHSLLALVRAVTRDDVERAIDAAIDLDIIRGPFDRTALAREIARMLDRYRAVRVEDIDVQRLVLDITSLIRDHRLRLPGDLALLLKTLAMHEATARRLDPSFAPIEVAEPYARRAMLERYLPSAWAGRLATSADEAFDLLLDAPQRVDRLLSLVERGNFQATARLADWEAMLAQAQRLVNRVVAAMLICASLISLSILLAVYQPSFIESWFGVLFWLGVSTTIIAGFALWLLSRWRGR